MTCVAQQLNAFRLQQLESTGTLTDVLRSWVGPTLRPDSDVAEVYRFQCEALSVRPNKHVCEMLDDADGLCVLDLSQNPVGQLGVLPVFAVLPLLSKLEVLGLSGCQLESPHVAILARYVAEHPSPALRALDLSDNPFSALGLQAMLEALRVNRRVTSVDVTGVHVVPSLRKRVEAQLAFNCAAALEPSA